MYRFRGKRDIGRKLRILHSPPAVDAPVQETSWEFRHNVCLVQENKICLDTRRLKQFEDYV